jgi:sugar phosphate isomerase/epimerase
MRIGLCAWSFTDSHRKAGREIDPHSPIGLIRLAQENNLDSIELASSSLQNYNKQELVALQNELKDLDLFLDTGGTNYADDITPLQEAIETSHRVGAKVVRTTISNLLEGDRRSLGLTGIKSYLDALVEPLKSVMHLAEDYKIDIGIENHQDFCSWELLDFCKRVGSPRLGVTMDVANALAVGETPFSFAHRILPILKHVHLKDYTIHPTESGYRFKRCALGDGVVNWEQMFSLFDKEVPNVQGCIELGASQARHISIFNSDYWSTYQPRPFEENLSALQTLHSAQRPSSEDWQTPHERGKDPSVCAEYEIEQFSQTISYLETLI